MASQPVDFVTGLGALPDPQKAFRDAATDRIGLQRAGLQNQLLQQEFQKQQTANEEASRYQDDVAAALANPTARSYADLFAKHPQFKDAISKSWETRDAAAKQGDLTQLGAVHMALRSNKPELAASTLERRIAAEKAAGMDTSEDEQILAAIKSGDQSQLAAAKGMTGAALAAIVGPEQYAKALGEIDKGGEAFTLAPGSRRYSADGKLIAESPFAPQYRNVGEGDTLVEVGGGDPASSGTTGRAMPATLPAIVDRIAEVEGTGKNPLSSSVGVGQFTKGTWLAVYKKNFPSTGETNAQILEKRNDPQVAKQMLSAFTQDNAQALSAAGVSPSADNIYLANFLGTGGALKVLRAGDSTPLAAVVGSAAIEANPSVLGGGKTVGDLRKWSAAKMAGGGAGTGASGARVVAQGAPKAEKPGYRFATAAEKIAQGLPANMAYQISPEGKFEAPTGQSKDTVNLKPVPVQLAKAIIDNHGTLREIDRAIALLKKRPQSIGYGTGAIGDWFTQRNDPAGTPVRAAIGKIGGKIIHDVSGAAVTMSEAPRFQPYVPTITDSADTALKKLQQMRELAVGDQADLTTAYGPENGYRGIKLPGQGAGPVRVRSVQEALKLAPGTPFIDPRGVLRRR